MSTLQATGFAQIPPDVGIARNDASPKFRLGTEIQDCNGNTYRYVKAAEAIAYGELVTHTAKAAWDTTTVVDGAITANTTNILHVDTNTAAWTINQWAGYWVCQAIGAGLGRLYQIKSHPAIAIAGECDVVLEDNMAEAFADGAVLYIFNPWLVELTDADTETIVGVGVGTITATYYGFVQTGGLHPGVLCDGSNGTAVVLNEPIVPYGTDPGQGQGCTENDATSDFEVANSPLIALAASTTDAGYVPAKFVRHV